MASSKIALITCGGTINSIPGPKGDRQATDAKEFLQYVPELEGIAEFEVVVFDNIDSSQANPMDWTKLAMFLHKVKSNYGALVLTHGTDTMAESMSAMSYVFGKTLDIPIVFTGSQVSMSRKHTDARQNLLGAFMVATKAMHEDVAEVMLHFNHKVFLGNRSWKHSEVDFDAFTSGFFPLLSHLNATPAWDMEKPEWQLPVFADSIARRSATAVPGAFLPQFGEGVVVTDLYPGTPPEFWLDGIRGGSCKGLILKTMGAGNVPYKNPRYNMIPVIEECVSNSIPVLLTLKFPNGMVRASAMYEAGQVALDAGAIPTGDMVHEAAYVKLLYLLALGHRTPDAIRKLMLTSMAGEVTEPK